MTQEEASTAYELDDMFILTPQMLEAKKASVKKYSSKDEVLRTKSQIRVMLKEML
jgi:hypothetical protein